MIKNLTRYLGYCIVVVTMFLGAACGKTEAPPVSPELAAPGSDKVSAQAEVKASSGPIELSLMLRETSARVDGAFWAQLRIRNVGPFDILIADRIFRDPRRLRENSASGYGIFLEATGPDGKPLNIEFRTPFDSPGDTLVNGVSGLLEVGGTEERAMVNRWKQQRLSPQEIDRRLIDFNLKKQRSAEQIQPAPAIKLQPGEAAETKYAYFRSKQDYIHGRPVPRPTGDFQQLDFFALDYPGKYQIRAVYDRAPTKALRKMRGKLPIEPDEVLVRTPWIQVTVLP